MSVVIKTEHLSCQSGRRFLIHDINWEVQKGDHWIIFGMNGCGKTTLLSTVAGFRGYTEGNLEVFGEPYRSDNIFSHRKRIGWVSSSCFDKYLSWESALDIVLSGVSGTLSLSKDITDDDVKRAKKLLEQFRLKDKIGQPFALMSKGERQCVLIARALISKPEILILDEPGTGLDIYAREYVLQMVENLATTTELTIIYVTHYAEEILPMFDKTLLLRDGFLYKQGKTDELFCSEIMSDFLGHQTIVKNNKDSIAINIDAQGMLEDFSEGLEV